MFYDVKFKKVGSLFWKKLKIKGDGFSEHGLSRYFILENDERFEVPVKGFLFFFSKKRFEIIKQAMEKEAGQPIATR